MVYDYSAGNPVNRCKDTGYLGPYFLSDDNMALRSYHMRHGIIFLLSV